MQKIENQCAFNGWFHTGYLVLGTIKKSKSSSILNCHWNTGAFIFFTLFFIFIFLISDIMLLWHTHHTTSDPVSTQTCNQWGERFPSMCVYISRSRFKHSKKGPEKLKNSKHGLQLKKKSVHDSFSSAFSTSKL